MEVGDHGGQDFEPADDAGRMERDRAGEDSDGHLVILGEELWSPCRTWSGAARRHRRKCSRAFLVDCGKF